MADVIDIGERQPHVVVQADGAVHVIPVSLLREVIAGREHTGILTEPVLRQIIEEWLKHVAPL